MPLELEKQKIKEFIDRYGKLYPKETLEFILNTIDDDIERVSYYDVVRQIYSVLGIIPNNRDLYVQFVDYIHRTYGLERNILEIGGGLYPALAYHINQKQMHLEGGSITVYDNRLITEELDNIKLYKQEFTLKNDISNYDLIIGMMPCDATELIIRSAGANNKEFAVAMCGCVHLNYPDYCYNDYIEYIQSLARDCVDNAHYAAINYFPEECNNPYPIISSKRKILK